MTKPVTIPNTFATQTGNIPVSQVDTNFTTLATVINDPATYSNYAVDGGAANAYVITLNPAPSTLASLAGVPIIFKAVHVNTGASTINVNGLGSINIFKNVNVNLVAGDIPANGLVALAYDGTNFQLLSSYTSASSGYYAVTVGTDTYTATLGLISYVTGTEYKLDFGNANTITNPTLNIDSLGVKNILRFDGSSLLISDLQGQQTIIYDGTNMLVKNPRHVLRNEELGAATATTAPIGTSTTQVATTAFVQQAIGNVFIQGTHLFGSPNQAQGATLYLGEMGNQVAGTTTANATETNMIWWPIVPVTIRDLYVATDVAPASGFATVTIRKNGAATTLTAAVAAGTTTAHDIVDTVTAGPGDYISFQCGTGAATGTLNVVCSVRCVDPGTGQGISLIPTAVKSNTTQVSNVCGLSQNNLGSTEPTIYPVVHSNCYLKYLYDQSVTPSATVTTNINAAGPSLATYKLTTGAKSPFNFGTTAVVVAGFSSVEVPCTASSFYSLQIPIDGAVSIHTGSFTLEQKTSTGIAPVKPLYFTARQMGQNATNFMSGHACIAIAAESPRQFPITAGTLKNFILLTGTSVPAGQTVTANIRINGVTKVTVVLTGAGTVQTDTTSTITAAAGDLLSVQVITSATTGTLDIQFACDHMT